MKRIGILLLAFSLMGCGAIVQHENYPVNNYPTVPIAAGLDAYILVGIHMDINDEDIRSFCEKYGTEPLLGVLLMGYVNGNRLDPWGLIHQSYTGETVPRLWAGGSSSFNGSKYVKSDPNGRNYLIFKVPAAYFAMPGNAFVFMGAYHTQTQGWAIYKLRQWPAKSYALPVDAGAFFLGKELNEQPEDIFSAWSFPVMEPAVYYLGELLMSGSILAQNAPMNDFGKAVLGDSKSMYIVSKRVGSLVDQAALYLDQTTLKGVKLIDVSNTYQSIPTGDFPYYKSGKK